MPLVALIDDHRVVAPLLDDVAWAEVKSSVLVLPCDARAVPKQNKYGTRYFAHWPGSHCEVEHKPESAEHLRVKEIIVKAAISAGWWAEPEVPADDRSWIADVLVTNGDHRVALEVQWTQQSAEEYHRRTARYLAAGVDCYWFARHKSTWNGHDVRVPVFGLFHDDGDFSAEQSCEIRLPGDHRQEIGTMVTTLLAGYPRRWHPLGQLEQGIVVEWIWNECYRCSASSQLWRCPDVRAFRCAYCGKVGTRSGYRAGHSFLDPSDSKNIFPNTPTAEMSEEAMALVGTLEKPAKITWRFTKTSGVEHFGFSCPACNAVLGNMFIRNDTDGSWRNDQQLIGPSTSVAVPITAGGHWCVNLDREDP